VRFTSEEVELLLQIARDGASGRTFTDRLGSLTETINGVVPAVSMTALVLDPASKKKDPVSHVFMRNGSTDVLRDYAAHYIEHDPMAPLRVKWDGLPHLLSDYVRGARHGRDAYTGEFLPKLGMRHVLGVPNLLPDGRVLLFALQRDKTLGDFTDRERALMRLISPDVAQTVSGVLLLEEAEALVRKQVDPGPGSSAIIFSSAGEVVHADPEACRFLVLLADSGLHAGALSKLVKETARGRQVLNRTLETCDGGHVRIRLSRTPLGQVLAVLELVEAGSSAHFELVADRAGLTRREREVTLLALEGLGNRNIARKLGTADVTVNFHLRNVYEKTKTRGRLELIALFLGSPPASKSRS
jgi:DNA-binding CsgD family transcriptional regulator